MKKQVFLFRGRKVFFQRALAVSPAFGGEAKKGNPRTQ
jgi:hypothetical protein